jgi:DNA polymerase
MTTPVLSIDFETASTADLRRTGVAVYAVHPNTRVLCLAYAFDNDPPKVWRPGQPFPNEVRQHVLNGYPVRAWNASFEWWVWNHTLPRQVPLLPVVPDLSRSQLFDTMAQAAYYGLPLSLDMAASAARVNVTKDKEGHALMMRMNKPRKIHADGAMDWWHLDDPDRYDRLCAYCARDVEAERAVAAVLPEVPTFERNLWIMDQGINNRGVGVDLNLVARLRAISDLAMKRLNREMDAFTSGRVRTVTSAAALLEELKAAGYPCADLRRGTVEERLADPACAGREKRLLELRLAGARTSTAKLNAMESAAGDVKQGVGTVRGMLQYYGAFRTGRWAGRLIQLQNLPRGMLNGKGAINAAVEAIMECPNLNDDFVDAIELVFGPALDVVASLLRACIVARPGKTLVVADKAQIEARVLPWLAGETAVLDVFRSGGDVYVQAAAVIYRRTFPADHKFVKGDVPDDERQIGKVAVLALGFGGGKGAFQTMAAGNGVNVGDERAEEIKSAWRAANPRIVEFWWALDRAFRAVLSGGLPQRVGFLTVAKWANHVVIRLPSGRALVYRDARLVPHSDDPTRSEISYMGLNQYTNKWERIRTYGGKLAENVTQAVARDCLAYDIVEAEKQGIEVLLTVHDELITEAPDGKGQQQLDALLALMSKTPPWAPGLPVGAAGWTGHRYRK